MRIALFLTLVGLCSFQTCAQNLRTYYGNVANSYNYWFYEPKPASRNIIVALDDSNHNQGDGRSNPKWMRYGKEETNVSTVTITKKPLVVFLHGASLCGTDLSKVKKYGTINALSRGLNIDAYILAPQNPKGSWSAAKINRLIDWAISHHDVDTTRIYVLGMSLGGYGTLNYVAEYPDRVAAAMGLCGGATSRNLSNLCDVPLCIIHGTGDKSVPYSASKRVVDAMIAAGDTSRLIFKTLPGIGHGELARYFYLPETYEWLFAHSTEDAPRNVSKKYDFQFSILNNVYNRLKNHKETIAVKYRPVVHRPQLTVPSPISPPKTPDFMIVHPSPKSCE